MRISVHTSCVVVKLGDTATMDTTKIGFPLFARSKPKEPFLWLAGPVIRDSKGISTHQKVHVRPQENGWTEAHLCITREGALHIWWGCDNRTYRITREGVHYMCTENGKPKITLDPSCNDILDYTFASAKENLKPPLKKH